MNLITAIVGQFGTFIPCKCQRYDEIRKAISCSDKKRYRNGKDSEEIGWWYSKDSTINEHTYFISSPERKERLYVLKDVTMKLKFEVIIKGPVNYCNEYQETMDKKFSLYGIK